MLFDTPIGRCGIAWSARGITRVRLPEASLAAAAGGDPPPTIRDAIDRLQTLLSGAPADLSGVPLDDAAVPEFHRRVYEIVRRIPAGETRFYGEIAAELGETGAARAVGQALGRNPWPIIVPCHRVLAAAGRPGGFSAPGGTATKMRLLEIDGASVTRSLPFDESS
jgi:methylated-DNA-[protein]-cysteine S-methyltransferase